MRPEHHRISAMPCTPRDSDMDRKCLGNRNCWACSFLCFGTGCALVAGLLVSYLFAVALGKSSRQEYLGSLDCHDCFTSGGLLVEMLNTSADPCQDFKAFVTSRWLPDPHSDATEHWKYRWDVKYLWMRSSAKQITGPHYASPPESILASSFRSCESRSTENAHETRAMFKMLLRILNIPWPEVPTGNADPFNVHFSLCVHWNIPLWFDVRLLPEDALKSRRAVYIGPSVYAKFWGSQYRSMGSEAEIRQYIGQYLLYFDEDYGENASQTIDSYLTFNLTRNVTFILEAVHENAGPEFHTFESLAKAFGQPPDHFIHLMNEYFRPVKAFGPGDAAIVQKRGTSEAVRYITANHDSALLRSHMGWWLLQIYAPIADARFFVQKYGTKELADLIRPLFCETQMESSFKILLFSKHVALNFPQQVRQQVDEIFHNVREETTALFEKSGSLAGMNVGQKLRSMNINLWPKPEYRSREKLQRIYASHYTSKATSLDHWITERRANAKLIGSDAYFEDKRLPHSFSKEPIYYDSLLNEATVSMLLAREPFFYRDGDVAANYGGLGAAFSSALLAGGLEIEAADSAVTLEEVTANDSMPTPPKAASMSGPTDQLPERTAPGFLPAFRAFQAHKVQLANDHPFAPEMMFFISYCHSQSRVRISFDCNGALRGTTSFVSAFHCNKGSNMNP
ncbi:endothelin-converting enzyme 1-like [Dermacentor albipictus]|uniref:endothelin-converting enzyme 1-like n=1 Tax=Dermacentor albipictus TaxID=60249 RepID=UPI0038FD21FC